MPYDPSLDVALFKQVKEFDGTRVTVGIFQYNGGEKKLQISRENKNQADEWRFAKLGRLNREETEQVLPLLSEALKQM